MSVQYESILEGGKLHWDEKQEYALSIRDAARWCLELVRPAVLTRVGPRKQVTRTAYLDGLRGFAALMVYWQHHQLWPRPGQEPNAIMENAYGYQDQYYFASLPGIRTFFTGGHFAVAVFFVISGYVLSAKPLSLIYGHGTDYSKLGENLASALFRRWLRLFLPVIGVSFFYMTSWHAFGIWTSRPDHQPTYREELWSFYTEFKNFSFLFGNQHDFRYNFPTWSIPVEFRGSIIIYTTLMAISRCSRNARLLCQVGLMFYFMYIVDAWYGAMFIAGMFLCELDQLARNNDLPRFLSRLESCKVALYYVLFAISIYFSGCPSHQTEQIEVLEASPGWYYLSYLVPEAAGEYKWFFLFWASLFLVSCIPRIWWLKSFFETRFNQYLGRISFALYLIHGPVLWLLGDRLYAAAGWYHGGHEVNTPNWINAFPLPTTGPLGLEMSFLAPHLILFPLTLWLAEIVTKLFDEPSVKSAQWIYRRALAPSTQLL